MAKQTVQTHRLSGMKEIKRWKKNRLKLIKKRANSRATAKQTEIVTKQVRIGKTYHPKLKGMSIRMIDIVVIKDMQRKAYRYKAYEFNKANYL